MEGRYGEGVKKIIEQTKPEQLAKEFSDNENETRLGKDKLDYVKADLYALHEKIRLAETQIAELADKMDESANERTFQECKAEMAKLEDSIASDIKEAKRLQSVVDNWEEIRSGRLPDEETWAN